MSNVDLSTVKYDKNKDLGKGERHMVFLLGRPFAYLKSHDLNFKANSDDVGSKMSAGFSDKMPGLKEYDISCEALLSTTSGHLSHEALVNLSASGKAVPFEISAFSMKTTEDGSRVVEKGAVKFKGSVMVASVSAKSSNGEFETCSCTLEGSGPLLNASGHEVGSDEALAELEITFE